MKLLVTARSVLSERDFRLLLSSQFVAQAADGFAQAAIFEVLVLDPLGAEAPGRILLLAALTLLPYSLVAPFMGVFVDRWSRRALLEWTGIGRGILLIAFPLWAVIVPGRIELYASVLILLAVGRLYLTTKGAALPVVVHEKFLLRANALSGGGGMISALLGGVVGVIAAGVVGTNTAVVVAGTMYLLSAFTARRISEAMVHPRPPARGLLSAAAGVARDLISGLTEIGRRPPARLPLIAIFLLRTAGMIVVVAAVLIIKREFPGADERFGRLATSAGALGAAGVGAFVGAATAPFLGRRLSKPHIILLGYAVSGIGVALLGGVSDITALFALTFIGGYGGFITKVAVDAQLQEALPDDYRGRAFSAYDILYNLATVAAAAVIFITAESSLRVVLAATGVLTLLLGLAVRLAMRRARMLLPVPAERRAADLP
ncbi:MAG: MFS transporter [Actinomycetota bacterium]|nr:MFS transporter [Actinomycetota bacterium]